MDDTKTLLTLSEVAARCRVRRQTVYSWVHKGVDGRRLEVIRIGGVLRTSEEALERFARRDGASRSYRPGDGMQELIAQHG